VNIAEVLEETLQQWALEDEKLVDITTSNIKSACTMLNWMIKLFWAQFKLSSGERTE